MIGKAARRVQLGYQLSKRSLRSIASQLATRNFAFGRIAGLETAQGITGCPPVAVIPQDWFCITLAKIRIFHFIKQPR